MKLHPEDRNSWPDALRRFTSQPVPFGGAFRVWSVAHGAYRLHLARVAPRLDPQGVVLSWSGVAIDLDDHPAGIRLLESGDALVREQEELRQFAYGASHDLREPVRMVQTHAELLERRCAPLFDESARETLAFLLEGARRLRALTDDLLTYSRVSGAEPLPLRTLQMEGVIRWAMMNLAAVIGQSGASITWDSLPSVAADENRIVLVVQNLLSNAIRFRRPGQTARVHVTAEQDGDSWVFCFADNGSGFDERFADAVFSPFKRLHGREIPGSGLGLAIARKVVLRHGGRIWVHSTPGEGSRFYFSLPA